MGELIVVTGPPGAGKSTLAPHLAERLNPSVLVPGDWFHSLWRRGAVPPWLPEAAAQNEIGAAAAARTVGTFARADCTVVYDGVVRPTELPRWLTTAGDPVTHYVVLLPSVDVCVERVVRRSGHGFTSEEAARAMHADFAAEGLDRYVVEDVDAPAEELAARLLEAIASGHHLVPAPGDPSSGG